MIVIYGLITLSFIVCIHEFGHYIAARLCGVRVESFSLGMGPILLHRQGKITDWRLSLLPFGGYCGMKGEKDFAQACEAGMRHIPADSDSLYGVHPLKRALIGFAGPAANFLLAVLCLSIVAMTGYTYYASSTKITLANELYPDIHSAAAEAGLQTGDSILAVAGEAVADFSEIYSAVSIRPNEDITILVERDGKELQFIVHSDLDKKTGAGKIGVVSDPSSLVAREAKRYSFFPALIHGFSETAKTLRLTVKSIALLFQGVEVTEAVSGPARITTMLGSTVVNGFSAGFRTGLASLLEFIALISVSLFFMNLLPIPILDGCLVLFSLVEALFRTEISPKIKYKVQYVGVALIALLFLLALSSDIHYFYGVLHARLHP